MGLFLGRVTNQFRWFLMNHLGGKMRDENSIHFPFLYEKFLNWTWATDFDRLLMHDICAVSYLWLLTKA
jgi:hypothetical protein